jgi:ABC-type molybdate transport system substrate-binding protein
MARKPKTKGDDKRKATWTLKVQVVKDVGRVFNNNAVIHSTLDTNNKTWNAIVDRTGVKKSTAIEVAKRFVKFLRKFDNGELQGDESKFDAEEAQAIFKARYTEVAEEREYEPLIERI